MDKRESEMKRDEKTINDNAEKLELAANTNMVTKVELLQKFVAKDVIKNKTITVAGQMFIEYEKEIDNSNQIIKGHDHYIGDDKIRNDILDRVCGDCLKEVDLRKIKFIKKSSMNRFIKILYNNKLEMLSNK